MSVPPTTDRDLWISWEQYHRLIERLALAVHTSVSYTHLTLPTILRV